ncbi:MAG: hypothetical protein Fur0034_09590 [Desulfuromonadia bacterium]
MTPLRFDSVRYRSLASLSFEMEPGETMVLTLSDPSLDRHILPLITGLTPPDDGVITLFGVDTVDPAIASLRQQVGMLPSRAGLVSNLKGVENVMLPLGYHRRMGRKDAYHRAIELLRETGYGDDPAALPAHLSPLDARRVSLARAIATGPDILIWKDAETGLALEERAELVSLFCLSPSIPPRVSRLCITHEPELFESFADRVVYG